MVNEYGVKLDSNGYAPSVLQPYILNPDAVHPYGDYCFLCCKTGDLARHEVFHGSNRQKSKALGCWVLLCPECHAKLHAKDSTIDWSLKQVAQQIAMDNYGWTVDDFRIRFGRSYL